MNQTGLRTPVLTKPLLLHQQRVFANPQCVTPSWYALCSARRLKKRRPITITALGHRFVVWRDRHGKSHVTDARCPHLGADLGQASLVENDSIRCAFHHWTFDPAGRCVSAPGHDEPPDRCLVSYSAVERFGLLWIYFGGEPKFDLPGVSNERAFRVFRAPRQTIAAHPHLVIGNGLDVTHFETLHDVALTQPPTLSQVEPHTLTLQLRGRPRSRLAQALTGTQTCDITASFTTIGGNLAWSTVESPVRFHVCFAARPTADGGSETQTVWFLPRGSLVRMIRAIALMASLLHNDRQILDRLDFHPSFIATDDPLRRFATLVDELGAA